VWERRFSEAGATENYFNQRVRSLLGETGLDERRVRVAWLNWQTPDVTEAVRHVAVVGCTRIIVAPSTLALPSLETVLDLGHAVDLARVPDGVHVITLPAWAEDDEFGDAVGRSAATALEELRRLTAH
jgi:protoheme ferro-lyase